MSQEDLVAEYDPTINWTMELREYQEWLDSQIEELEGGEENGV